MFAEERQEKLLGILREKRKVAVSEMCDVFNVSGATIRADLRQLEEEGKLNNTSLAQFTAADRIDTVVVDRLPDDVQAYRNAGIQVISLDEENLL